MSRLYLAVAICLAVTCAADAQDAVSPDSPPTHPTLNGSSGNAGVGFYQPGRWGLVQTHISNPTDKKSDVRVIFRFSDQPQRQFIRELSLPPKSRRLANLPVRFGQADAQQKTAETEAILTPADAERELSRQPGLVRLVKDPSTFVIITDNDDATDRSIAVLGAVREHMSLSRGMGFFNPGESMRYDVGWDGIEVAGIVAEAPDFDPAQAQALRRWIHSGGTLVVFSERVNNHYMQRLLPSVWSVQEVDELTLTTVPLQAGPDAEDSGKALGTIETETPIAMKRVVAPGFETLVTVNGWPALLSRSYGQGKVVVLAIDGPAWTDPAGKSALSVLSKQLVQVQLGQAPRQPGQVIVDQVGTQFVADKIGYRIVPRTTLAIVLGGFLLVLVIGAALWWRNGRLERLGALGVIAAVAAAGVLIGMGQQQRQQIAPTRSALQFVQAQPGAPEAQVTAMLGLYHPAGGAVKITGETGGYAWPAEFRTVGALSRLRSDDLDRWTWMDVPLSAGAVRPVELSATAALTQPLNLSLRFTQTGLAGRIDWPHEMSPEDLLLTTLAGNLSVTTDHQGATTQVAIDARADVLPPGVLMSGAVLGQAQQDRARVLAAMLAQRPFDDPMLLAWTSGLNTGVELSPELTDKAEALWAIPLRIQRSNPGDEVRIPWPLMTMEPLRDRGNKLGLTMLPIYQPHTRTWIEQVSNASAFLARFHVPAQVLPLKPTGARVHLDITATGRTVRLLALTGGKLVELAKIDSPTGPNVIDLPADKLEVDPDGGIVLAFDVSPTADQARAEAEGGSARAEARTTDMWSVRQFGLEVAGIVQGPDAIATNRPETPAR